MTDLKTAWKKRLALRAKARKLWAKADVHMARKVQLRAGPKILSGLKTEAMQNLCRARGDIFWAKAEITWAKALIATHGQTFVDVRMVYRECDYDCVVAGELFRHTTS